MPLGALPAVAPGKQETVSEQDETTDEISPLWNVLLLDDDWHSVEYVIEMLQTLIGCPTSWGFEMALEVHNTGRVIIDTTTLERARDLQKKVHEYGADPRIPGCQGSMTAVIEPSA